MRFRLSRWSCAGAVLVLPIAAIAAPNSSDLSATFDPIKTKMEGGGVGSIAVLGDSLSFRPGSWLYPFESSMAAAYGDAGGGYQGNSLWTGAGYNYGWLREGINEDMSPHHSLDGLWNTWSSAAWPNQAYVTPLSQTVQIQYVAQPANGSFTIEAGQDGAAITTISTASAQQSVQTYQYTLPTGQTQYTIQPLSNGPITILGENNISGSPGVRIHRVANGGWGVNNFLQRDWTFDAQFKLMSPDLVFVWLGQNDQGYQTADAYAADIEKLVNRIKSDTPSSVKICLVGTYDQGSPALPRLVDGMYEASVAENVGFLNVYSTAGDAAFFQNNGYLDDGVHFSTAGGNYVGNLMFNAFQSDGASLPEPASLGGVVIAGVFLLRRRG